MKLLTLVCVVLLMGVSLARVGIVAACSGAVGPDNVSFKFLLDISVQDIYLAGRIHAVSDSGINAVLQVDRVIKGEVLSEYILLFRNSPSLILEDRGLEGCSRFGPRLIAGQRYIAGLWHSEDGTYRGDLFKENQAGLFQVDNPDQQGEMLTLTYEQIIDYVAHRLNTIPYLTYNSSRPRAAALSLKTESGQSYILPVDQESLIKSSHDQQCSFFGSGLEAACMRAPNGIDTVTFFPSGSDPQRNSSMDHFRSAIEGETGVFSQNSELITVWEGQELHVYATGMQRGIAGALNDGMAEIVIFDFDADDRLFPGAGAWSSNGRTFAFSSQSGVWLWDALTPNSQPALFLAVAEESIIVRGFSPGGNYLALATSSRRYHIDIVTRQEYPDGLFSPDDRLLAAYDTTSNDLTPLDLERVLPTSQPVWGYNPMISQFEWIDRTTYIYASCGEAISDPEIGPGFDQPWCKVRTGLADNYHTLNWVDGILFDYDPITHSLATLIDGDTITVNGEIIELEGQTDSPIVAIELIPLIDMDYRNF